MLHERIKRARILRNMTLQQVADALGDISKQAISKYEQGRDSPSSTRLIQLARVFAVKPEYFFRTGVVELGEVEFRKHSAFGKREQAAAREQVREQLERYLDVEALFDLGADESPRQSLHRYAVKDAEQAERAANALRTDWELGTAPITNLTETLEEHGIKVVGIDGHERFDGLCAELDNGTDAVVVFNANRPGERQRFNLAHELGHLMMRLPKALHGTRDEESLCHRFAAALLFPAEQVKASFGERRQNVLMEELLLAKQEWGLSMQAVLRRLLDANILAESRYRSAMMFFSSQRWRTHEPGALPAEQTFRLRQLVLRALAEELVSPSRAAELLATDVMQLEGMLAGKVTEEAAVAAEAKEVEDAD